MSCDGYGVGQRCRSTFRLGLIVPGDVGTITRIEDFLPHAHAIHVLWDRLQLVIPVPDQYIKGLAPIGRSTDENGSFNA